MIIPDLESSCSLALALLHCLGLATAAARHAAAHLPHPPSSAPPTQIANGVSVVPFIFSNFTLPLVMISLSSLHLCFSVERLAESAGAGHLFSVPALAASLSPPHLWLVDATLLTDNLLLYLTYLQLIDKRLASVPGEHEKPAKLPAQAENKRVLAPTEQKQVAIITTGSASQSPVVEDLPAVESPTMSDGPESSGPSPSETAAVPTIHRPAAEILGTGPTKTKPRTPVRFKQTATDAKGGNSSMYGIVHRVVSFPSLDAAAASDGAARPSGRTRRATTVRHQQSFSWQNTARLQDLARLGSAGPGAEEKQPAAAAEAGEQKTVEVLHVDDDPVQHIILGKWLKRYQDVTITRVKTGQEALELLQGRADQSGSVEAFPTLVVMDQLMPGLSGTETSRQIRELHPKANMPIIITSSLEADEIRSTSEYLASGVNDIVTKPINKHTLTSTIVCQLNLANLQRNTHLLKSILPESIIARLTEGQKVIADKHEQVSILFSDIVGYTSLSARTPTPDLIRILNSMFTAFDRLTDKHGVYKVETIGDAYMAAAGHSEESARDHSRRLINMAQDMVRVMEEIKIPDGTILRIRVGIHTGPAYAGVVGEKCPRYCFFGDTVNTASRMESTSFPQCVQVSQSTFSHVNGIADGDGGHGGFDFCTLPARAVKGKGVMQTFLVKTGDWQTAEGQSVYYDIADQPSTPVVPARRKISGEFFISEPKQAE